MRQITFKEWFSIHYPDEGAGLPVCDACEGNGGCPCQEDVEFCDDCGGTGECSECGGIGVVTEEGDSLKAEYEEIKQREANALKAYQSYRKIQVA